MASRNHEDKDCGCCPTGCVCLLHEDKGTPQAECDRHIEIAHDTSVRGAQIVAEARLVEEAATPKPETKMKKLSALELATAAKPEREESSVKPPKPQKLAADWLKRGTR
jgi:hypothetical protein